MPVTVRDRQRRRKIPLACEPCRERKSRCDGGKPICSTCQRRSLGLEQCIYNIENARTASTDEYIKVLHERIRRLERACIDANVEVPSLDSHLSPDPDESPNGVAAEVLGPVSMPHLSNDLNGHNLYRACDRRSSVAQSSSAGTVPAAASMGYLGITPTERRVSVNSQPNVYDPSPLQARAGLDEPDQASSVTAMGTVIGDDDASSSEDFYGSSSTASFLKEAVESMKSQIGSGLPPINTARPSNTNNPQPARDARRDPSYYLQVQNFALPPRDLADHLMDRFRQKVYYMHPFFHLPSFENAYRSLWQPNHREREPGMPGLGLGCYPDADATSIVFHCALNAIFALSCHFSDLPPVDRLAASHTFFLRAKSFVGLDLIEANNLGVVQALLVVALTLQSTPYPSRCWNATGLACRVAQGLGLHTEHRQDSRQNLEKEIRRRTWYGCVTMDMLVSMTYGRPTMTTQISSVPLPCGLESRSEAAAAVGTQPAMRQASPRYRFYVESIRLCGILEDILSKMYQPWLNRGGTGLTQPASGANSFNSLDAIIGLHARLTKFEAALPPVLSWTKTESTNDLSPEDEYLLQVQRTVLYSRFIYLRIMLLRPILTQLCMNEHASTLDPLLSGTMLHCAKSCVEASIELLDVVYETYQNEETGAWWWDALYACTAGIVLIIARTCPLLWPPLNQQQMDTSWEKCEDILQSISAFSVSGRQSLKLLQIIHGRVQTSKENSSFASPSAGLPNDVASVLMQGMPFETNHDTSLPGGAEFQGFEDLGLMGSFFSWDTSLFDTAGPGTGWENFS